MKQKMYIGRYSQTQGISIFNFDNESGDLTEIATSDFIPNSSYLHLHEKYLYAVIESNSYQYTNGGGVAAFSKMTNHPVLLNETATHGSDPCHLISSPDGQLLFCANYSEGSFSAFQIMKDGALSPLLLQQKQVGHNIDPERQTQSHVHFVTFTPDKKFLAVVDLGLDQIICYEAALQEDQLQLKKTFTLSLPAGTGPRHLVFSKDGRNAYVIGELSNTISSLSYSPIEGFSFLGEISTLPTADIASPSACAALKISADGRYLYASNRGHDSITVFAIDQVNEKLQLIQNILTAGKHPRDITLDCTENYLFVANTHSDSLAIFRRNQDSGLLHFWKSMPSIEAPTCIVCEPEYHPETNWRIHENILY